ncbi:MAG: VanZ family protein [Rikenellaceae bacterium]
MKKSVLVVLILYVSLITALSVIELPDFDPIKLDEKSGFTILDKLVHICFYFGLNFLMLLLFASKKSMQKLFPMICISVGVILYSCMIELVQLNIGREGSMYDVIANTIGTATAVVVFRLPSVNRLILKYI